MATPGYLNGNEWGEAEFRFSHDRECWLELPLGHRWNQPPTNRMDLLRTEGGEDILSERVDVYRVKYPQEE